MQKIIKSGESHLTIDTQGGKIVELVLEGKKILGAYQRIDGKVGATHICTPNFAGEGMQEYGLPFHGPARTREWLVVNESQNMIEISVLLEALEKYKSALEVRQIFSLIDSQTKVRVHDGKDSARTRDLSTSLEMTQKQSHSEASASEPWNLDRCVFHHEVIVKNIGTESVPVNIGIHNYFDTPNGWQVAKINGKNIKEEIEKNLSIPIAVMVSLPNHDTSPIRQAQGDKFKKPIEAISDNIHSHPCDPPDGGQDQTNNLSDSGPSSAKGYGLAEQARMTNNPNTCNPVTWNLEFGTRNLFRIATQGASEMVTWSAVKNDQYDDKYACVEPVCWFDTKFFGAPPSLLSPGETRILKQTFCLGSRL